MVGRTIAHFQVIARIGAGGMGEVYRAVDTQLRRDVALKLLPDAFTSDPQRVERFQREAHLLAALNHPNVAAIYGVAEARPGEGRALVMELVEGPTLADRLVAGPLGVPEALDVARQIAEAIEYAHERAVIHRDLKPANIKLTDQGQVKVLDFGLAKVLDAERNDPGDAATVTSPATQIGVVLGTAAYMPPEQAKGRVADRRSDVWAFGVVLFEMLAGARPFKGDTVSETLASVIRDEPDWRALPAETPRRVRELLERCLTKDVRRRLQAIGEARIVLEGALAQPSGDLRETAGRDARSRVSRLLPWAAGALAVASILMWAPWRASSVSSPSPLLRLAVELSPTVQIFPAAGPGVVLSPDGTAAAFRGREGTADAPRLYVRRFDELNARVLAGTEDVTSFFFSPNGQWLGFFTSTALKKVHVAGGDVVTLSDTTLARGGSWTEDGRIVFAASSRNGLSVVSDAGGAAQPLTRLDVGAGEITHRFPQVLPGGREVLFTSHTNSVSFDEAVIKVQSMSGGTPRVVLEGGYAAQYVPSGHLLFMHQGTLYAVPFDLSRLMVTGPRVPVVQGVANAVGSALAQFSASTNGVLAYLPGTTTDRTTSIVWLDSQGKVEPVRPEGQYLSPRLAPDGARIAVALFAAGRSRIWVYDTQRETMASLNAGTATEEAPIWTPDGARIVYSSDRDGQTTPHLYWKRVDGGAEERLTDVKHSEREVAGSFTPDGRTLLYSALDEAGAQSKWDVFALRLEGSDAGGWKPQAPVPLLHESFDEVQPALSPDGRWLAYVSNESGKPEVYVRRYPELDHRKMVSNAGGSWPTWSRDTKELFFTLGGHAMVVGYTGGAAGFDATRPRQWSSGSIATVEGARNFDVHPSGQKLLAFRMGNQPTDAGHDKAVLVFGLFDELRRLTHGRN